MKTKSSRTISRILTLTVILAMLIIAVIPVASIAAESQVQTAAETGSGVTTTPGTSGNYRYFKEDTSYDMTNKVDAVTFEFELAGCGNVPGTSGGVIIGNYSEDATSYINIEVRDYGRIRVRGKANGGSEWVADFDQSEADIRTNSARHYAIVLEYYEQYGDSVHLYVDGVKKATRYPTVVLPKASEFTNPFRIGGDYRSGNTNYFKGLIYSVAMYSDMRTANEVKADATRTKTWKSGDGLIAAYDITKMGEAALRDYSGNGNTLVYNNGSGIQVENFGKYEIDKKLESDIDTFEAWINLPKCYTNSIGGTIIGNYRTSKGDRVCLEIYKDGNPRLSYTNENGTTSYHRFTDVNLKTGTWQHLVVVNDVASGEARCYVDGVLIQTLTGNVLEFSSNALDQKFLIGRDTIYRYAEGDGEHWENRQDQYFKGFIKEIRLYSDVRTADEIAADYSGSLDNNDAGLLACYQISPEDAYSDIEDVSGNGYDAKYKQLLWEKEYVELPSKSYSYSLAIVGDTQTITYQNPALLKSMYQWILDNQASKNIQYVIGLGDITEYGVDVGHTNHEEERANAEWAAAKEAISLMDGKIPYSLIRGDGHDGIELYNQYFGNHKGYTDNIAGYYQEGRIDNVYHTFKAGTVDYLLLSLDHGTKDDVLVWANEVVAAHPNHQVIVTTHHYMKSDGTLSVRGETGNATAYDSNNNAADDLWNKFLSKHPNISMVICGHSDSDDIVITKQTGDHGNEVTQILVDPQTMDAEHAQENKGMVAMLYFSEDGTDVQVEYYSTIKDTYRPITTNEFTVTPGTHDYTADVTAPTCTEAGYTTYTCPVCNDSYVSDTVAAKGHDHKATVTYPTCTESGFTTYTCACGDTYTGDETAALGHDTDGAVATQENYHPTTCMAPGSYDMVTRCLECGEVVTSEHFVINQLGHTWGEYTHDAGSERCGVDGTKTAYCLFDCGNKNTVVDEGTALTHAGGEAVVENSAAPNCVNTGSYDNVVYCTACGVEMSRDSVSLPALGHIEETVAGKAPTCTETGLTEGKKCTVCGVTTVAQNTIPANGHSYDAAVTAPDCTNGGYTTFTCTVCGDTYTANHVEANGHSYNSVVTAPTCTIGGYTTNTCSTCGDEYVSDQTPATGHTGGEAVVENNVAPDCVNLGYYENAVYCTACGTETSRVSVNVPATGHTDADTDYVCDVCGEDLCTNHSEELIPGFDSTCTATGLTDGLKCSICGDILTEQEEIPAKGHNYDNGCMTLSPTCTEKGIMTYTCYHDDSHTYTEEVEAFGHNYDSVVTDPTCVNGGYTTYTCTECGHTYKDNATSAFGHAAGEITVENNVAPDCVNNGSYDNVVYCTTCGTEISRETVTVVALGHTEMTLDAVDPTCTETGLTEGKKCTVCGTTTVEQTIVSALGHTDTTLEAVAPTCTKNGLTEGKMCTVCGVITVNQTIVPAIDHDFEDATTEAPKTCKTCGATEGEKLDASAPTDENVEETDFMSSFEEFIRLILEFLRQLFGLTEEETSARNL